MGATQMPCSHASGKTVLGVENKILTRGEVLALIQQVHEPPTNYVDSMDDTDLLSTIDVMNMSIHRTTQDLSSCMEKHGAGALG